MTRIFDYKQGKVSPTSLLEIEICSKGQIMRMIKVIAGWL